MAQIKKAVIEDLEAVVQLFDEYRIFYGYSSDITNARKFIADRIISNDSEIFICFNEANRVVGFVQLYPLFSSTRMKKLWLLNDLYVDVYNRNKGYSIQLITKAKELCRLTNACGIMLETSKENTVGNSLYPKAGFRLDNEHNYYNWDNEGN